MKTLRDYKDQIQGQMLAYDGRYVNFDSLGATDEDWNAPVIEGMQSDGHSSSKTVTFDKGRGFFAFDEVILRNSF